MYKKIIHHIVEEHFDHPIATELKSKIEKKSKATIDYMGRVIDPLTGKPAIDPRTGEFVYANTNISKPKSHSSKRSTTKDTGWLEIYDYAPLSLIEKRSINRWACLNWRIRNLVISITAGGDDIDIIKAKIAGDITKISELLIGCYGEDAAKTFRKLLTDVVLALSEVLMSVKADEDTTKAMTILNDSNKALGDFAEAANTAWPSKAVVDIFTQVENLYIMQAISRIKKEWAAGVSAADNAYDIMVVEQDNGDPSFADIFSAGILSCIENTIQNEVSENSDYMET
jgi:hypothetical protein